MTGWGKFAVAAWVVQALVCAAHAWWVDAVQSAGIAVLFAGLDVGIVVDKERHP